MKMIRKYVSQYCVIKYKVRPTRKAGRAIGDLVLSFPDCRIREKVSCFSGWEIRDYLRQDPRSARVLRK